MFFFFFSGVYGNRQIGPRPHRQQVLCAAVEEQHSDVATAGIDFDEERSSFPGVLAGN